MKAKTFKKILYELLKDLLENSYISHSLDNINFYTTITTAQIISTFEKRLDRMVRVIPKYSKKDHHDDKIWNSAIEAIREVIKK